MHGHHSGVDQQQRHAELQYYYIDFGAEHGTQGQGQACFSHVDGCFRVFSESNDHEKDSHESRICLSNDNLAGVRLWL